VSPAARGRKGRRGGTVQRVLAGKRDFYRNSIEFPLHYTAVLCLRRNCGTNSATFCIPATCQRVLLPLGSCLPAPSFQKKTEKRILIALKMGGTMWMLHVHLVPKDKTRRECYWNFILSAIFFLPVDLHFVTADLWPCLDVVSFKSLSKDEHG